MIEGIEHNQWAAYFDEFNRQNRWRPTRLGVFDEMGEQDEERGIPLVGVSLEADHEGRARLHIMLGDPDAIAPRHRTFTITAVKRVMPRCGLDGRVERLEIEDEQGGINLLRFEPVKVACSIS